MSDLVAKALALWGFDGAKADFVAGRENRVYRVRTPLGDFALRLKRPGYRRKEELLSELHWLDAMDHAGLSVPRPRRALSGALLEAVEGQQADMVGWLAGQPLGDSREPLALTDARGVFRTLGAEIARLHTACDAWQRPAGFVRGHWDAGGLLGEAPLWGRFWENPGLDAETRQLMERLRAEGQRVLQAQALDYGLIHADLVRENILVDGTTLRLLDFDDGGFGYRLFDLATVLLKTRAEPDVDGLKAALLAGYRSRRPLDDRLLDLFITLRAVTYVGWIVPRMNEDGASERNARFIAQARTLCRQYFGQAHTF